MFHFTRSSRAVNKLGKQDSWAGRKLGRFFRPCLEFLEDRTLPSTSIPLNSMTWTAMGPTAIDTGSRIQTGRIPAVAADPTNANIIYIGAAGGGVWKTVNAGTTWTAMTDTQQSLFMGAIVVAPSDANTIYAGTGEAANSLLSYYGQGILVSTDAGATWTLRNAGGAFVRKTISALVVEPANPLTVYAAVGPGGVNGLGGSSGIWKSTDGGTTWTNTTAAAIAGSASVPFSDVVMDPTNPQILYAAIGDANGDNLNGVYQTTDGGTTWTQQLTFPQGSVETQMGRIRLSLCATSPQVLYGSIHDNTNGDLYKLMTTTDGGASWTWLSSTPNYLAGQGYYDNVLLVDPANPNTVYAGGAAGPNSFTVSNDAGVTWTDLTALPNAPHPDHQGIAIDMNGVILDGNDGGLWAYDPVAGTWANRNGNLNISQFLGIAIHPTSEDTILGGTQDNGTALFADSFTWDEPSGGDGGEVVIDQTNPSFVYHIMPVGSSSNFFRRSINGGVSFTPQITGLSTSDPMNFYPPFVMDPSNRNRLLLGSDRLYETVNASTAITWSQVGPTFVSVIDAIAIAPTTPTTVYVAEGGRIQVSLNSGTTFSSTTPVAGYSGNWSDILVDPADSLSVWIVASAFTGGSLTGQVFHTTNGGTTWVSATGTLPDLPAWSLAMNPRGPGTADDILFVGNDQGVYSSTNGGTTWARYRTGLPNVQARDLEYSSTLGVLAVGTHGRGVWEIYVPGIRINLGGTVDVTEAGPTDTYTIVLESPPTANVRITLTPNAQLTVSGSPLTFTTTNWDTAQTVTVTAVNDAAAEGMHTGTITYTVTSADTGYNGTALPVLTVNVTDNDSGGVTVIPTGGTIDLTEGGATDTFTVVLTSMPTANVNITLTNAQVTAVLGTLVFTTLNWNVNQTVTVTAINDLAIEGAHNGTIAFAVTSTDGNYSALPVPTQTAAITDNDFTPGVIVLESSGSTNVTEAGPTDTYTVVLNSIPLSNVTIAVNATAQISAAPTPLIFTTLNWNVAQTVTVSANDDSALEGPHTGLIMHVATSGDGNYNGIFISNVTAQIVDNETVAPSITVSESGGSTSMVEGAGDSYTIVLNQPPTANVVINLTYAGTQITFVPATLTFTPVNWNIPQGVAITAIDDIIAEGSQTVLITHGATSSDTGYNGIAIASVTTQIVDNDGNTVQGSGGVDLIVVTPSADKTNILVSVNGKSTAIPVSLGQVLVQAGDGNDTIQVTGVNIPIVVDGGLGNDLLFVVGSTGSNSYSLDTSIVTANTVAVSFSATESLVIAGKSAPDTLTIVNVPTIPVEFKGDNGADTVIGPNFANAWAVSGTNSGTLDQTIKLTNVENWTGGTAADSFAFLAGKYINLLDGGSGNDLADFTRYGVPITANMQTNIVSGTKGFTRIEVIVASTAKNPDTIIGANQTNAWNLTAVNAGDVNGLAFQSVEKLTGGTQDDTFLFADGAAIAKIDAAAGTDLFDYSAISSDITVNLTTKIATGVGLFANLEGIVGGAGSDTLVGTIKPSTWTLSAADVGTVATPAIFSFAAVEYLTGGPGIDTFRANAAWSGLIDGAGGFDVLHGSVGDHVWDISGINAGSLDGQAFQNIENLIGNSGSDTFTFQPGQKITGKILGGTGSDILDYSALATAVAVNLQTLTATAIGGMESFEQFIAPAVAGNSFAAANLSNVWNLTAVDTGTVNATTSFTNFQNLMGGTRDDFFSLDAAGAWTGTINGSAGADVLVAFSGGVIDYQLTSITAGTLNGQKFTGFEKHR